MAAFARVSCQHHTFYTELAAIEDKAKQGKVDPSKVLLTSVIYWVVRQKFPPPTAEP